MTSEASYRYIISRLETYIIVSLYAYTLGRPWRKITTFWSILPHPMTLLSTFWRAASHVAHVRIRTNLFLDTPTRLQNGASASESGKNVTISVFLNASIFREVHLLSSFLAAAFLSGVEAEEGGKQNVDIPLNLAPSTTLQSMDPVVSCDQISPNRRTASTASGTSTVLRISSQSMFLRSSLRPPGPPDDTLRQRQSRSISLPSSRSVSWNPHVEVWRQPSRRVSWSAQVEVFVIPAREESPGYSNLRRVKSARDCVSGDGPSRVSTRTSAESPF